MPVHKEYLLFVNWNPEYGRIIINLYLWLFINLKRKLRFHVFLFLTDPFHHILLVILRKLYFHLCFVAGFVIPNFKLSVSSTRYDHRTKWDYTCDWSSVCKIFSCLFSSLPVVEINVAIVSTVNNRTDIDLFHCQNWKFSFNGKEWSINLKNIWKIPNFDWTVPRARSYHILFLKKQSPRDLWRMTFQRY